MHRTVCFIIDPLDDLCWCANKPEQKFTCIVSDVPFSFEHLTIAGLHEVSHSAQVRGFHHGHRFHDGDGAGAGGLLCRVAFLVKYLDTYGLIEMLFPGTFEWSSYCL